jgi:zinc and cadmium transporter
MSMLLAWILGFSLLGSLGAVGGAALLLAFPDKVRQRLVPALVAYAAGTLLGAAFLGMIPAAVGNAPVRAASATVLAGIVLFFLLERLVLWRHGHEAGSSSNPAAPLILVGDAFHNFVDGVVIAAAFLTSVPLGIAAGLAVAAHEVPQEVGDFAILLDGGYSRPKALALNALSSTATLPGALAGYFWLADVQGVVPYVLALSAASFIYIAVADLLPGLHRRPAGGWLQLALILAGIGTIAAFHFHR